MRHQVQIPGGGGGRGGGGGGGGGVLMQVHPQVFKRPLFVTFFNIC